MNKALISVIVPIYNVERYLSKCVESILDQSYKNLEIILVDDGSPDNCNNICKFYKNKDERIIVVEKKNGGLSDARNAGLKVASGEYVIFLDSDDYIEENLINDAYIKITENSADICYFDYSKVDEQGNYLEENVLNLDNETYILNKDNINKYIITRIFTYKHGVEAWNKLYNMKIIRDNNLTFSFNNEIFAEDLLFNLTYLTHVKKIVTLNKSYYNYLIRQDSIMGKPKENLFGRYIELFDRLDNYWNKYNPTMSKSISLGYFIWLIFSLKTKLNENTSFNQILTEFKSISRKPKFKDFRNDLLKGKIIKEYIYLCPNRLKHAIFLYLMALICFFKGEYIAIKLTQKLLT